MAPHRAVDVVAALYGSLLPTLRELCGLPARADYPAPEDEAVPLVGFGRANRRTEVVLVLLSVLP